MTRGLQIALALDPPEPISARQAQRNAARDRSLDALSAVRADLIAIADRIAPSVQAQYGGVTGPRLLLALRAAGYGEMLDAVDARWAGAVLLPSRGWRRTGELVNEGSKGRPVPVWVRVTAPMAQEG